MVDRAVFDYPFVFSWTAAAEDLRKTLHGPIFNPTTEQKSTLDKLETELYQESKRDFHLLNNKNT